MQKFCVLNHTFYISTVFYTESLALFLKELHIMATFHLLFVDEVGITI